MRRVLLALVSTAVCLVLLLSYKTSDSSRAAERRPAALAASPAGATTTILSPATTRRPATSRRPTTTNRGLTTTNRGPTTTRAHATTTQTTAPSRQQVLGPVVQTQYGPVQVRVTLQGGRIVDVAATQLPSDAARSVEISNHAAPILHDEVLQAQSAQIDAVSGATYTSRGYVQSLQAALDSARAGGP
jgi:uncharacterized protein with FMN-binding domain